MPKFALCVVERLCQQKVLISIVLVWILLQVLYAVLYWNPEWVSDPGAYQYHAKICAETGVLYPSEINYYDKYIWGPGWINIMAFFYKIFGTFRAIPFVLIAFNVGTLIIMFLLCKKILHNYKLCYVLPYLMMSLPAFGISHIQLYSEYAFLFFATLSMYLFLYKKTMTAVIAGTCIALGLWIRPLAYAWIVAALVLLAIQRRPWTYLASYIGTLIISCLLIANQTHKHFPNYLYKACTGGVNLIMGADDTAFGGYNPLPFEEGQAAYIPDLLSEDKYVIWDDGVNPKIIKANSGKWTYAQCDSIYKARSIKWIKRNPGKWLSLIPAKLYYLYGEGSMTSSPPQNAPKLVRYGVALWNIYQRVFVALAFVIGMVGLCFPFWKRWEEVYIVLPIVVTTAMTVVCVSAARYNFVVLPLLVLFALLTCYRVWNKVSNSRKWNM